MDFTLNFEVNLDALADYNVFFKYFSLRSQGLFFGCRLALLLNSTLVFSSGSFIYWNWLKHNNHFCINELFSWFIYWFFIFNLCLSYFIKPAHESNMLKKRIYSLHFLTPSSTIKMNTMETTTMTAWNKVIFL